MSAAAIKGEIIGGKMIPADLVEDDPTLAGRVWLTVEVPVDAANRLPIGSKVRIDVVS